MMRAADAVDDAAVEPAIVAMLADSAIAYLHLHFTKPGCYVAVDRALVGSPGEG